MMSMEIKVADYDGAEGAEIRNIRHLVFSREQGVAASLDLDGQDSGAVHVLAQIGGKFVGTGRMLSDGHIGRLAVLRSVRGKRVGEKIMHKLQDLAKKKEMERIFLGAQEHAVGFYEKLGFSKYGFPYVEAGIRHLHMEKIIHPPK